MESCSMFVRGGVYVVVRDAMGPFMAQLSVSALMFDYILTGPISVVSAGQYLGRLLNEFGETGHIRPRASTRTCSRLVFGVAGHRLLLVEQHQGHSRIQRQGAAHHADHHRDGGGVPDLVPASRCCCSGSAQLPPAADARAICISATKRWAGSRAPSGRRSASSPSSSRSATRCSR